MKKIELEIVALSHSITQTHSYAVVLGEINGLRRLPIVIGGFEAQAIAVALEKMRAERAARRDKTGTSKLTAQEADRSGFKVIACEDAGFRYEDRWIIRHRG